MNLDCLPVGGLKQPRDIALPVLFGLTVLCNATGRAFSPPGPAPLPDFDKREAQAEAALGASKAQAAAAAALQARLPQAEVGFHRFTGAPRIVAARDGFLTGKAGRGRAVSEVVAARYAAADPLRGAKAFLEEHRQLFGHGPEVLTNAQVQRNFITAHNGLHTVVWEQQVDGLPVYEAVLMAHTTKDGELVGLSSQFVAEPAQAANAGAQDPATRHVPKLSGKEAVAAAAAALNEPVTMDDLAAVTGLTNALPSPQQFKTGKFNGAVSAHLVWLPMNRSLLRLCWQVELTSRARGETYRVLVDARSGEALLRQCLTVYLSSASFRVFTNDSPTPFSPAYATPQTNQPPQVSRSLVTWSALDTNASPAGWIDDGVNETRGNNVDAHLDRNADDQPDLPRPQGAPFRVFDFPLDLTQGPAAYESAAVVQLFYRCNWMHDRLYQLGFTEAAGNFQNDNFGRGGLGSDAVQADAQDGSGYNNSNFTPSPDGSPPRIQMYRFTGPTPNRDGDFDSEVVCHEYTHGLSSRLVGGGVGISQLQTGGMGEGWSDWYALSLLSKPGDNVDGCYSMGGYASYLIVPDFTQNYYFGIRRYPYTTDLSKNPLTFKDVDPAQASAHAGVPRSPAIPLGADPTEVHMMGEVWCVTLWEARANLIRKLSYAAGNQLILQLVTDGMKLSPPNPNFLEARDAILQADRLDTGGANQAELWRAFAKRGLGYTAESPPSATTTGVSEAFDPADDLLVSPRHLAGFGGPAGGPFIPVSLVLTLTNQGSAPLQWALGADQTWLKVSPASGTLEPGGPATVLMVILAPVANALAGGDFTSFVWLTNLTSGVVQQRSALLQARPTEYLTEFFSDGDFDLAFSTLTFTPDGSSAFYGVCVQPAATFPTDPSGGSNVVSGGGYTGSTQVSLPPAVNVSLFGRSTNAFEIDLDGGLIFSDTNFFYIGALYEHFNRQRVSALYQGINFFGSGGFELLYDTTVGWKQQRDRVAVTFQHVYAESALGEFVPNDFQIEMFFDGRIRMTYLAIGAAYGVVGLSRGQGFPADFVSSDFSVQSACLPGVHLVLPTATVEGAGVLTNAGQVSVPMMLATNLVVSLSSTAPAEAQVPSQVIIPAGTNTVFFNLTIPDDAYWDGTQRPDVLATAPGFASGTASISVYDRQAATLGVSLPASITEGDAPARGVVVVSKVPAEDVMVALASSDPNRLNVDPAAIIPAGQTSAVFSVSAMDDLLVNGDEPVTITAQVANWVSGAATMTVRDNDTNLWVDLVAGVTEGQATWTNAGTVRLGGYAVSNVTVTLQSSLPSRLVVPASVMIPTGGWYANFGLTPVDDNLVNGPQTVTVIASALGLATGSNSLVVYDNDIPVVPFDPQPPNLANDVPAQAALSWISTEGDRMVNGGFETGDFSGWTLFNFYGPGGFVINDGSFDPPGPEGPVAPLAGKYSALAQQSGPSWCELQQVVTLPLQAAVAELQWTHRLHNFATSYSNEFFTVQLNDTNGNSLGAAFWTLPGDALMQDWTTESYDLTAFLGQTILIRFVVSTSTTNLNVDLDNIGVRLRSTSPTLYSVYFGTNAQPGPAQLLGTTTNTSWPLPLLAPLTTYYWQVAAQRSASVTSGVWQFTTRGVDHFDWSPLSRVQTVNTPFLATTTARDYQGRAVTNFSGPANLRGLIAPAADAASILVTEVGRVESAWSEHHWIEFMNVSAAPIALDGWQVTFYPESQWPAPIDTFTFPPGTSVPPGGVFTIEELGDAPGAYPGFFTGNYLTYFAFLDPVAGVLVRDASGRIVDFFGGGDVFDPSQIDPSQITDPVSIPASQWSGPAATADTSAFINPSFQRVGNLDQNNALDWTVGEASQGAANEGLSVPFVQSLRAVAVSPTSAAAFTNGVWAGWITVQEPATDMQLEAATGSTSSRSGVFSALLHNDVGLTLAGVPDPVAVGQELTYVLTVNNSGPNAANGVVVTNSFSPQASFVYAAASQGAFTAAPGHVVFSVGSLSAGASATLVFAVVPSTSGWLTNTAVVTHYEPDSYAGNNTAQEVTAVMPVINIGNITNLEGNVGTTTAVFPVYLSSPFQWPVTVNYTTANGTALAGSDYLPAWGQLMIPPGATSAQIAVNIRGDLVVEPDETFFLNLSSPSNATLANTQAVCTILNDDGMPGAIYSLVWSNIPSRLNVKQSIPSLVRALDTAGNLATNFTGTVSLSARATAPDTNSVGGNGFIWFWNFPLGSSHTEQRTQAIYPAGGLGGPGRIVSLALHVNALPDGPLSSWTIRLKHTALDAYAYDSNYRYHWEDGGWTIVYQAAVIVTNSGWTTFMFQTPFDYNGTDNLMVDLSFHNAVSGSVDGNCFLTVGDRPRALHAEGDSGLSDPLTWSGTTPLPEADDATPDLQLVVQRILPILPVTSGNFDHGSWSGSVALQAPGTSLVLAADDGNGHTGLSNPFDALLTDDVSLTMAAAPDPLTVGQPLTYTLLVTNTGPDIATGVLVTNWLPPGAAFLSASSSQGTFNANSNNIVFSLGALPGAGSARLALTITPRVSGHLTNFATVSRAEIDNYAGNNSASVRTAVLPTATVADIAVTEGNIGLAQATFTVTLSGAYEQEVQIHYFTSSGTATSGVDFLPSIDDLYFSPGFTSAVATVSIVGDISVEPDETFFLNLVAVTNVSLLRAQAVCTILNDDGFPGDLWSLQVSPLGPRYVGEALPITITGRDAAGGLATNFSGQVLLSAWAALPATNVVGAGIAHVSFPFDGYYHNERSQVIYLSSELGAPGEIAGLGLNLDSVPNGVFTNWTIRLKHSSLTAYSSFLWESNDWQVVYQTNLQVAAAGWVWFPFQTPFAYAGYENLMVDFSFFSQGYAGGVGVLASSTGSYRALDAETYNTDDPRAWSGTAPAPYINSYVPNLQVSKNLRGSAVAVQPLVVGPFTNGVWSGSISISAAGSPVVLQADDQAGHTGLGNVEIASPPTLGGERFGNSLLLFWPTANPEFVLESSHALTPPAWAPAPGPPLQIGDFFIVPVDTSDSARFYRLRFSRP